MKITSIHLKQNNSLKNSLQNLILLSKFESSSLPIHVFIIYNMLITFVTLHYKFIPFVHPTAGPAKQIGCIAP